MVERLWQAGRSLYVHCRDPAALGEFDELLWTFHDTSFVPHALRGAGMAERVLLGCEATAPECVDTLVNLHDEVPGFFSQFEHVLETAGHDDSTRQRARIRYRFYKERGYPLATRTE
jgi:DNA polymerase-3 subunit chi